MSDIVHPLSQNKRRLFFLLLVGMFLIGVPIMVFYAIGYRLDGESLTGFKAVGGIYIESTNADGTIFVDEELVEDMRTFRSAAYVQNLEEGVHRVHVQSDGAYTWVKELPVFSHFVTEAKSFNMPSVPQIRLITEQVTPDNTPVTFSSTTEAYFVFASSTPILYATSTRALFEENIEYIYVKALFAKPQTAVRTRNTSPGSASARSINTVDVIASTTATSTKKQDDSILFMETGELYVGYTGKQKDIPYYYCVTYNGAATTSKQYGEHVYRQLTSEFARSSVDLTDPTLEGQRLCRSTIAIDRMNKTIKGFYFYPGTIDIVLLLLDDGLYVTEVDDRSWQNAQLLYPGHDISVMLDGGQIYIQDGDYYLEVYTEIAEA